jgi:hypothetical protein
MSACAHDPFETCTCRKHLLRLGMPWLWETQLSADAASQTIGQQVAKSALADRYGPSVAVYDLAALAVPQLMVRS